MSSIFNPTQPFLQTNAWQRAAQNSLQYNTSIQGSVVPLIYGTVRQQVNLVALANFIGQGGGKKGKGVGPLPLGGTNTVGGKGGGSKKGGKKSPGDFSVDVDFVLCQGPVHIFGNNGVYVNAAVESWTNAESNNAIFYDGRDNQAADPTFASVGDVVGYSGTCHITITPLQLGSSPVVPNLSFEINGFGYTTGGSSMPLDCNPGWAINDFLTNDRYGAGFPAANLTDLTNSGNNTFGDYCQAIYLAISVSLNGQQKAIEWVDGLVRLCNSALVWSGDQLKIIPYGDLAVAGNGAVWTPYLTPAYAITDDFLLPWHPRREPAGELRPGEDDPLLVTRNDVADANNWVSIQYTDRGNFYNATTAVAQDQSAIDLYGLRMGDNIQGLAFSNVNSAVTAAQLELQRSQYILRNMYKFKIGWQFGLIEPMDILTLTGRFGDNYLNGQPVRVAEMEEDDNGDLTIVAEEIIVGAHAVPPPPPGHGPIFIDVISNGLILLTNVKDPCPPPYPMYLGPILALNSGSTNHITTSHPNEIIVLCISATAPQNWNTSPPCEPPSLSSPPAPNVASITGAGLLFQRRFQTQQTINVNQYSRKIVADLEVWWAVAPEPLTNVAFDIVFDNVVLSGTIGILGIGNANIDDPWDAVTALAFNDGFGASTATRVGTITTVGSNDLVFNVFASYTNNVLWEYAYTNQWGYGIEGPDWVDAIAYPPGGVPNQSGDFNAVVGYYVIFNTPQTAIGSYAFEGSLDHNWQTSGVNFPSWIGIMDAIKGYS